MALTDPRFILIALGELTVAFVFYLFYLRLELLHTCTCLSLVIATYLAIQTKLFFSCNSDSEQQTISTLQPVSINTCSLHFPLHLHHPTNNEQNGTKLLNSCQSAPVHLATSPTTTAPSSDPPMAQNRRRRLRRRLRIQNLPRHHTRPAPLQRHRQRTGLC